MAGLHPWMPFYVFDWLEDRDVKKMSRVARSFYFDMLCHEWVGGPLPDDPYEIARLLGEDPRSLRAVWPSIRQRFDVDSSGKLCHFKLESLRNRARLRVEKNTKAAILRHSRHANALPEQSCKRIAILDPDPESDPDPDILKTIPDSPSAHPGLNFDAVYAIYPRKEGKKKGLQRCKTLIKTREKYDALLKAVGNYAASITDVKFAKHFDTFMNCWEDYVEYTPPQSKQVGWAAPASHDKFTKTGDITDEL